MNISHGCFAGTEAQFDSFRLLWATAAGYGVSDHRAQGGPLMPNLDFTVFSEGDMVGDWPDGAPIDPLLILLVHDEQGGRVKWEHCPVLADRLEELESALLKSNHMPGVLVTQQFVRGLRTAAHYHQDVIFS